MAEDDIYGNKGYYEMFKQRLPFLHLAHNKKPSGLRPRRPGRYYCRNRRNILYFQKLVQYIEAKDLSYIRRIRLLRDLLFISHHAEKDLASLGREDINKVMIAMHSRYRTPHSKTDFVKHTKYLWKALFPEKDEKGRTDESIIPYPVRHLTAKIDKSRQKMRQDKLAWEEFELIINYFSNNPRIQAYLTLATESLARPQELLYRKIGNLELYDNYAKIWLTEHGKEGTGILQCIDSYPYLLKWLNQHPLKKDKNAYLFVNTGSHNTLKQLKPSNINKMLRKACKDLSINKPVTCYSLKRNGVTMRRLRGDSDMEIQHAARWASTKQLKTYDLSNQDEAFKRELQKRGLIPTDHNQKTEAQTCPFCNTKTGFAETICPQCKRPLDKNTIREETKQKEQKIQQLQQELTNLTSQYETIKQHMMQELMQEILKKINYNLPDLNGNLSSSNSSKKDVRDLPLASSSLSAL